MRNANELRQVVSMQQRSYQLLLWLAQLVDRRSLKGEDVPAGSELWLPTPEPPTRR